MKQMDVFKKIGGILKELNDQYDYLKAESSDLNELELELFVANAHFLKDHAEILRRLHERNAQPAPQLQLPPAVPEPIIEKNNPIIQTPPPVYKQESIHEQRYFEPVVQQKPVSEARLEIAREPEPEPVIYNFDTPAIVETLQQAPVEDTSAPQIDLTSGSAADSYSFEREEPETTQQEFSLNEADTYDEAEVIELVQEEEKPQPAAEVVPEPEKPVTSPAAEPAKPEPVVPAVATSEEKTDEYKVLTLNQKMFAQRAEKQNTQPLQARELPITDLKSAINLNDKLLYIKDLFNGYSLAYSEAIEIVNRFNTYEEAERFLKTNYVNKNNWEAKPATSEKFFSLLKRRYPVN